MNRKNIKLVVFDLDGTLVDAYAAVTDSLNTAFKKLKLPQSDYQTVKRSVGWGEQALVKTLAPKESVEEVLQIYRDCHKRILRKKVKVLPGVKDLLRDLKKEGLKLSVASNRPTEFTCFILKILKIDLFFDLVLCADKVKHPKPFPDLLLETAKFFRLKSSQVLYVGDMIIDVQTGQRAKVKTIAVATGSNTKNELASVKPYQLIDDILRVKDFIN